MKGSACSILEVLPGKVQPEGSTENLTNLYILAGLTYN